MPKLLPKKFEDPTELGEIREYYAVENILTADP